MILRLLAISFLLWSKISIAAAANLQSLLNRQPQKIEDVIPGNMGERDHSRLSKAQQLMADGKFADAIEILKGLESSSQREPYVLAQVSQTLAYTYAQKDDFKEAARYFQKTIDLKALPLQPTLSTMYSLAQVYVATEKYREALPLVQDFLFNKEPPDADAYFFYGQLLAQLDAKKEAVQQVEKAISLTPNPKESWYRLLVALYYDQKNFSKAAEALLAVVNLNPDKKEYWKQLSSIYVAAEQDDRALATLEVAYKKGFLTEEKDIIQLAQLSMFREVPYKAGQYLQKAFDDGILSKTRKNYELLADSWIRAQEIDLALNALDKAAPLSDDGTVFVRQGQLYLEKEQWKQSVKSLQAGLKKGGLNKPGVAYIAMGIAQFKLGDKEAAISAFQQAQKFPQQAKQAIEWINHLNSGFADTH